VLPDLRRSHISALVMRHSQGHDERNLTRSARTDRFDIFESARGLMLAMSPGMEMNNKTKSFSRRCDVKSTNTELFAITLPGSRLGDS
jgi:hypothetical protein